LENYIQPWEQVSLYFEDVPIWPISLLLFVLLIGVGVDVINRRRRDGAVEYFEEAFQEELAGLYPAVTRWPDDLAAYVQPRLPVLRDAFEVLRVFLPQNQLREYNAAWNRFYEFVRTNGIEQAASSVAVSQEAAVSQPDLHQRQQDFHNLVADLLAFTKQFKK